MGNGVHANGHPAAAAVDVLDPADPTLRPRKRAAELLVVALLALAAAPNLLEKISGGARQNTVIDSGPNLALVRYTQLGLVGMVVVLCTALVLYKPAPIREVKLNPYITSLLLGWSLLTVNDLRFGSLPSIWSVLFPLVVLALWVAPPPVESLKMVGVGGVVVAGLSVGLGAFLPSIGIYANADGEQAAADKGLISDNLLAGVFTSTNNLGQLLVLALPFVFLLRSAVLRAAGAATVAVAILWCGSRSAIVAAAVGLVMLAAMTLGRRSRARAGGRWSRVVVACAVAVSCALPYLPFHDVTFSGRANIWAVSLRYWQNDMYFGLGSRWYAEVAGLHTDFGQRSQFFLFHAHNQLLQFLVTGGLVGAAVFLFGMYRLTRSIERLDEHYAVAVVYLVIFWVSGSLEVNLGMVDRYQFYGTALVPLVVLAVGRSGRA